MKTFNEHLEDMIAPGKESIIINIIVNIIVFIILYMIYKYAGIGVQVSLIGTIILNKLKNI